MPIHLHPDGEYVKKNFNERLGRYETYYIVEAYENANTMLGLTEDADVEEFKQKIIDAEQKGIKFDWTKYVKTWPSQEGDLYLIPSGSIHGTGGHQMILEMDTCPSNVGTEYSFFLYDFARNSWDDESKTMTGKPCKMHLEHGFDNEKWVTESYSEKYLQARPHVVKWTQDYQFDRYASEPRMPFEIERFHFEQRAENDTKQRFAHILTVTVGTSVTIRSLDDPSRQTSILKWQSAVVPACFGAYEIINDQPGPCTVVQLRWKNG